MVLLVALVPLYVFIPNWTLHRTMYVPELAWDRLIPLQPAWGWVYGALYAFLILLPVLVVHQQEHIRRTVYAYLTIWITAYVFFLVLPTVAPRPDEVPGDGFAAWGLRVLYDSDPPYNCFPSLHVAHSFVSALTCLRVHRRLGIFALGCAALVGISTLFTKQHYIADVIAGACLAFVAHVLFLRGVPRAPEHDRRIAPALALVTGVIAGSGIVFFRVLYEFR